MQVLRMVLIAKTYGGDILGWIDSGSYCIQYKNRLHADRQKIENYLAHKWGLSTSTRLGEDGTVRVVRPQVSSLEFTDGTLTIDTDKGEIAHSDGSFLLGEFTDKTFTAEEWHGVSLTKSPHLPQTRSIWAPA